MIKKLNAQLTLYSQNRVACAKLKEGTTSLLQQRLEQQNALRQLLQARRCEEDSVQRALAQLNVS